MKNTFIILILFLGKSLMAQNVNQLLEEANALYQKNEFAKASEKYRQVLKDQPDNLAAEYNLGIANYKIGDVKKANDCFIRVTQQQKDKNLAERSYYNIGVLLLKSQKLQQAVIAFKNALKLDVNDTESRENLQLVFNKLRDQTKQQPVNSNQQQKTLNKSQSTFDKQTAEQLLNNLNREEKKFSDSLQSTKRNSGQEGNKNW